MGKSQSKARQDLTPEDFEQLVRSTAFSKEEVQAFHDEFKKDFPNGFCDKKGFKAIYSNIYPQGSGADKFADHIFHVYDIDGNGKVSFDEFLMTLHIGTRGSIDEKLKAAYRMYDIDGNKCITEKEVQSIMLAMYKASHDPDAVNKANHEAALVIAHLDATKNKKLSEAEFIQAAKANPAIVKIVEGPPQ